jgi:glycerol uptake facilitator-like aquaporin
MAEFTATAFLLIAVVGSGVAAERLCDGNVGLALLVNAVATGCALFPLILAFGPVSGAHMNPIVTIAAAIFAQLPWKSVAPYVTAQVLGALAGVCLAHAMFDLPILQVSTHIRTGPAQWVAEIIAAIGLLGLILRCHALGLQSTAGAVAAYITGAYWFTASTSFANPAVTVARAFTNTFAGIRPSDAPGFIGAQFAALGLIVLACKAVGFSLRQSES